MAKRTPYLLVLLMLAVLVAACTPNAAPPVSTGADAATATLPAVTIEVTADGLQVPAEIPAGIVTVAYKNSTDAPASPSVGWLMEGRTVAEFEQALQEDNFPAILEMAITPGGAELAPGESKQVTHESWHYLLGDARYSSRRVYDGLLPAQYRRRTDGLASRSRHCAHPGREVEVER